MAYSQQQTTGPNPTTDQSTTITLIAGQVQNIGGTSYYVQATPGSKIWENYASKTSKVLGGFIVTAALLNIIFNIIGLALYTGRYFDPLFTGHGFWGSIFFLLSGGFAIGAGQHRTTCHIVANLVLGILAAVLAGCPQIAMSALGLGLISSICDGCDGPYERGFDDDYFDRDSSHARKAVHAMMLALSILQFIAAISVSCISCSVVCCGRKKRKPLSYELVPTIHHPVPQPAQSQHPHPGAPVASVHQPGASVLPTQQPVMYPQQQPGMSAPRPYPQQPGMSAPITYPQQPGAMAPVPPGQYYPPQGAQQGVYPQLNAPTAPPPDSNYPAPPSYNESFTPAGTKLDLSKS